MRQIDVVYLAPHMPAITYRAYPRRVDGFCLIECVLQRLRTRAEGREVFVLCHDSIEAAQVEPYAQAAGVPVVRASGQTRLEAFSDFAQALPGTHLACFRPEIVLAPSSLPGEMWKFHLEAGNHYTRIPGFPHALAVEIFDSAVLASLGRIGFPGVPPGLTYVMEQMAEMRDASGEPRLKAIPFRFGFGCDPPPAELRTAGTLSVETEMEVSKARAAVQDAGEAYGWDALARWNGAEPELPAPQFSMPRTAGDSGAVLYVSACSGYSGAEECLRGLVEGMQGRGWAQYAVVGMEGLLADRLRAAGADVFCPNWQFHLEGREARRFAAQLFEAVRVDLVHCNSDPGGAILEEARARGIPVVTHLRVAEFESFGRAVAESDHLIAVSEFVRARLLSHGVPADRVSVVYDGVDVEKFHPARVDREMARIELGIGPGAFAVLLVARLAENKRHELLLQAARLALHEVPELQLVFVGREMNAPIEKRIAATRDALKLGDRLLWLPFQEDIRRVESACDAIVLCSDAEPLGTCVLEGMALGLPVVVTTSGGTHELIEAETSGLATPGGDAEALASALCRLGRDGSLRRRLGEAARLRAERLFSLEEHARRVSRVFDAVRISR